MATACRERRSMDADQQDFARKLGAKVRILRAKKKLTRLQLAEKCGLGVGFIRDIEQGVKRPMFDNAIKIADALDISCKELHDFADLPKSKPQKPGRPKGKAGD